jgi:UDP-N-acetylglucosamine 2-epimerase
LKVAVVVGTRPQIIKSAPIIRALTRSSMECAVVNTGQHYDYEMNRQFFEELSLPDADVDLQVGQGTPCDQVSRIISGLEQYFRNHPPNIAIVPGDTNSAVAAGIACSKLGIKIAHLEAGARSYDARMVEELNRRVLDQISQLLLCATPRCKENLIEEHTLADEIVHVGDTMYDSLLSHLPNIETYNVSTLHELHNEPYAFMTLHRAENSDVRQMLESIFRNVGALPMRVLLSVHPRTKKKIEEFAIKLPDNVVSIDPLPYVGTLALVKRSKFVITDSGGLQKEAFWLSKPVIIVRPSTEWMEIVDAGAGFLVNMDDASFRQAFEKIATVPKSAFEQNVSMFGNGKAAEKVVDAIDQYLLAGKPANSVTTAQSGRFSE